MVSVLNTFIHEVLSSPAAFFLGSDSDARIRKHIRSKGFVVVEGKYDVLVYHPAHWRAVSNAEAMTMLEGFSNLPPHGAFDAGADHPYSHVLLPISQEAVALTRRLFGLTEGSTFKDIIVEAMSRRDFLKKAAMTAAAGAAAGPAAAAKSIGGAVGSLAPVAMKSVGGASLGRWLADELWYTASKETLYKAWKGAKESALKHDPTISDREIKTLEDFLKKGADFAGANVIDYPPGKFEESAEVLEKITNGIDSLLPKNFNFSLHNDIAEDAFKHVHGYGPRDPGIMDQYGNEETWWNEKTDEYVVSEEKPEGDEWISDDEYREKKAAEWDYGRDPDEFDEFEGFDDIPYVDDEDDNDRPWLGEFRAPAPSLRHLMKAWPGGKEAWLREMDNILS